MDRPVTMDSDEIVLGDRVYDVLYGNGTVREILVEGRFRVQFDGKKTMKTYAGTGIGVRYSKRTLFWHDPLFGAPPKDESRWHAFRPIVVGLIESLRLWRP